MEVQLLGGPFDGETRTVADDATFLEEPIPAAVPIETPHGRAWRQVIARLHIEHRPDRARPIAVWREPRWDENETKETP